MSHSDDSAELSGNSDDDFDDSIFEESADNSGKKKEQMVKNQPFDEALDVSQSVDQSFGGPSGKKETKLTNEKYDEALDISASLEMSKGPPQNEAKTSNDRGSLQNAPFDEAYDLNSESEQSVDTRAGNLITANQNSALAATALSKGSPDSAKNNAGKAGGGNAPVSSVESDDSGTSSSGEEEEEEEEESGEQSGSIQVEGAYNPKDYAHLNVSSECRDLFKYIERYKPHEIDLETSLKCFIPEYIPAVGEMDAFLKVPRPDHKPDDLGLKVLDEPAASQSDPTVLELQLRAVSKKTHGDVAVRSIEDASKRPEEIERWIKSINDLHRTKPPPQVHYKRNMPDIESLMAEWPEEFEKMLHKIPLPSVDMAMTIEEYVRAVCAILDIPVYDNPIESLHVLFSLFMDFNTNQHFVNQQGGGGAAGVGVGGGGGGSGSMYGGDGNNGGGGMNFMSTSDAVAESKTMGDGGLQTMKFEDVGDK